MKKKVSRDSSWHVPENNNVFFFFFFGEDLEDNKFKNTTNFTKIFTTFKIIICNLYTIKMMLKRVSCERNVLIIIIICHFDNCEKNYELYRFYGIIGPKKNK